MPNHVLNVVEFYCDEEKAAEIRRFMQNDAEEREFDFNKLIPMPEHIFRGNLGLEEREKYGADNWYDWSIQNWGTKWNAYDVSWSMYSVCFDTAWSSVPKIIKKLSEKFPDVKIDYRWADEDIGYNVGAILGIIGGDMKHADWFEPEGGSNEAFDLFFAIHGADPEDFDFRFNPETGQYEYMNE